MCRFFWEFLDEYRLNFIFVKFSTKNFYEKIFYEKFSTPTLPR